MTGITNHLWQSTVIAAIAIIAARLLSRNQAKTRYWLWFAASIKFLIPFGWLLTMGGRLIKAPAALPPVSALAVEQITSSFAPVGDMKSLVEPGIGQQWPNAIAAVWLLGALFLFARWLRRWWIVRQTMELAERLPVRAPIPVVSAPTSIEPGVFGIFRPRLLLPAGIATHLSEAELDAILAHELSHVRRRDNLTAALHMVVEALFWFHPLVWWIGAKLVEERERACDEAVLNEGKKPEIYAQGILNVCKFYVESPLKCSPGVSGADLRKRIEQIMTGRVSNRLMLPGKLILAYAGVAVLAIPLAIGILRAQTLPPPPQYKFEVASIRPGNPDAAQFSRIAPGPQGGLRTENTTALQLITFAYDLRDFQIAGGPGWIRSDRFNVTGTPDRPEEAPNPSLGREKLESMFNRQRQRMQALLLDRFALVLRAETREMPIYGLVAGKSGHKLKASSDEKKGPSMRTGNGSMTAAGISVKHLANVLSSIVGRPVMDETGITGDFDFQLEWTPEEGPREPGTTSDSIRPSIFTALQEQLGLKLESKRGPAPVLVIEKIEKPSAN